MLLDRRANERQVDLLMNADHLGRQGGGQRLAAGRVRGRPMLHDRTRRQRPLVTFVPGLGPARSGPSRAAPCGRSPAAWTRSARSSPADASAAPARSVLPCSGARGRCGSFRQAISQIAVRQGGGIWTPKPWLNRLDTPLGNYQ